MTSQPLTVTSVQWSTLLTTRYYRAVRGAAVVGPESPAGSCFDIQMKVTFLVTSHKHLIQDSMNLHAEPCSFIFLSNISL